MKVRILKNSIRLRLKQTEVQSFKKEGNISEVTAFGIDPSDELVFMLSVNEDELFKVHKSESKIVIEVPKSLAKEWTDTSMVGFNQGIETGKGKLIKLLVEKDFACLDGSEIENIDTYPNPSLPC
jgi:hypothetical protein